ncbi:MAG: type II toxin-antitoxin system PemK/MazF family toxin [SAR202 cluster bacterium]|nr:type II toxin-antitoxin system PemK/MazF family toxin [SAR202 cluster bacterium]
MSSQSERDFPRCGDIFDVQMDPSIGAEIGKTRPAVIVSNDINNRYSQTVTVVPITGQPSKKVYPYNAFLPKGAGGLTVASRAKADQIRTVDKVRLLRYRGSLTLEFVSQVQRAVKAHLGLR